ncbi:Rha family transcriptional regulator [Vagococcus humatus]|uniref:Rha family transcriptional regulator n=1 Tax=Vagococcus humatus TaxID=1889241 RepID=A0A3S0ACQ0_9ENTE|nr:Rha family transcriptional regulator [Vagococcus humatus]RST88724.1 hypothetical protein C7P63_08975 [Vagococcus humatus]
MKELVFVKSAMLDEVPFTTSLVISEYADIEHRAVSQMVRKYHDRLEGMGKVTFKMSPMASGQKAKVYILNEVQATFLITLLKNTNKVVDFKEELSKQFFSMKQELMKRQMYRELEKPLRRTLTDSIKEWEHVNKWAYKLVTDLICKKITGMNTKQLKQARNVSKGTSGTDIYTVEEFEQYQRLEHKVIALLDMNMTYEQIKAVVNGESIEFRLQVKEKVGRGLPVSKIQQVKRISKTDIDNFLNENKI